MGKNEKTGGQVRGILIAIQRMSEAENEVLSVLSDIYGEEQGIEMTRSLPFKTINDEILSCLKVVISENPSVDPMTI